MKFSIIIPAYCAEKTLWRCLQSVENQSFPDFEAIVVDDGSLDSTAQIAMSFANRDSRFQYIYQENQGVSVARNSGINHAAGEFLVFLDSDDQYDSDYLLTFHQASEAYPNCDHFWCGFRTLNAHGETLGTCTWSSDAKAYVIQDRSIIMSLHEKSLDAALWNKMFRRETVNRVPIRMNPELSLGEDLLFNFAYLDACTSKIVLLNKPLYCYTKDGNTSLDSKYRGNLLEIYQLLHKEMLCYLRKWNVSDEQLSKYYTSVFFALERVLYNTYRTECTMTLHEKRRFNRALLSSPAFQTALKCADCRIHFLYRCAYSAGSWDLVVLLNRLRAWVNRRRRSNQ